MVRTTLNNCVQDCAVVLARAGCDIGLKDIDGETGREIAERDGHTAVIGRLRALVAEQLGAAQTPPQPESEPEPARAGGERLAFKLAKAAEEGNAVAVTQLLAEGVNPNALLTCKNLDGKVLQTTPLI